MSDLNGSFEFRYRPAPLRRSGSAGRAQRRKHGQRGSRVFGQRTRRLQGQQLEDRLNMATLFWQGLLDTNWGTSDNWASDLNGTITMAVPTSGDTLVFDTTAQGFNSLVTNNDLVGLTDLTLTINDADDTLNAVFQFTGNAIGLAAGGLTHDSSSAGEITSFGIPLTLTAAAALTANSGNLELTGNIANGGHLLTLDPGTAGELVVNASISGAGGLEINATSTSEVFLAGASANTYGGATTVSSGGLSLEKSSGVAIPGALVVQGSGTVFSSSTSNQQIADSAAVTLNGGLLVVGGGTETIGSLAGTGTVQVGSMVPAQLVVGANNSSTSFTGTITSLGPGSSLLKVGAGTFTLGGTVGVPQVTIFAGTLLVNGLATGNFSLLAPAATLGGTGTINGLVSATTGTLAPGNGVGTLNVGPTTLGSAATFSVELQGAAPGTGHDQLAVTGTMDLGDAPLQVSVGGGYVPANGSIHTLITATGGVSGTFQGLAEGDFVQSGGCVFVIHYNPNSVTLEAVSAIAVDGTPDDDLIVVERALDNVRVFVNGNLVVDAALACLSELEIFGLGGSDLLVVDYAFGNPIPAGTLRWLGGESASDADELIVENFAATNMVVSHTGPDTGTVQIGGGGLLEFAEIEPLFLLGTADNVVVNLPNAVNQAVLGNVNDVLFADLLQLLSGGTFEGTFFRSPSASLTLSGGNQNDTITVHDYVASPLTADVILNGNSGNDSFTIAGNQQLAGLPAVFTVNGGGNSDSLIVDDSATNSPQSYAVANTQISRAGGPLVNYAQLEAISLFSGQGNDLIAVASTSAAMNLNTGNGDDLVLLGSTGTLDGVAGSIALSTGMGNDRLVVNDSADTSNNGYGLSATGSNGTLTRSGVLPISFQATELEFLDINAGSGNDTMTALDLPASLATALRGFAGNDVFIVSSSVLGPVVVEGGSGGIDRLGLPSASVNTVRHVFGNAHDGAVEIDGDNIDNGGLAEHTIFYNGLDPIDDDLAAVHRSFTFSNVADSVTLGEGAVVGDNRLSLSTGNLTSETVDFIAASSSHTINLDDGGSANDSFTLPGLAHLAMLPGLAVHGGGGTDSIHFDDSAAATGDAYALAPNQYSKTGTGSATYTQFENVVARTGAGNDSLTVLGTQAASNTVFLGSGNDTALLQASALGTQLNVHGEADDDSLVLGTATSTAGSLAALQGSVMVDGGTHGMGTRLVQRGGTVSPGIPYALNSTFIPNAPGSVSAGDRLVVNDAGGTGNKAYNVSSAAVTTTGFNLNYANFETARLNGDQGNNQFNVSGLSGSGLPSLVVLDGGAGGDNRLTLNGTSGSDVATVGNIGENFSGSELSPGAPRSSIEIANVSQMQFLAGSGNDVFHNRTSTPALFDGGTGNDISCTENASGGDVHIGGTGIDFLCSVGGGNTLLPDHSLVNGTLVESQSEGDGARGGLGDNVLTLGADTVGTLAGCIGGFATFTLPASGAPLQIDVCTWLQGAFTFTATAFNDALAAAQAAVNALTAPQVLLLAPGGEGEFPFHNETNQFDVNADQRVSNLDLFFVLQGLRQSGPRLLAEPSGTSGEGESSAGSMYYDVSGDNRLTNLDIMLMVARLRTEGTAAAGEGESDVLPISPLGAASEQRAAPEASPEPSQFGAAYLAGEPAEVAAVPLRSRVPAEVSPVAYPEAADLYFAALAASEFAEPVAASFASERLVAADDDSSASSFDADAAENDLPNLAGKNSPWL